MRRVRIFLALTAAVLAGCSGDQPEQAIVTGVVRIGPTPGPCLADRPCSRPAAGVMLLFSRAGGDVVPTTSDERGRYQVTAEPGRYRIRAVNYPPPASLRPSTVTVERHMRLDLVIDSGVR
jgi:hypothetical protein